MSPSCSCCTDPCPCECILVEFTELDNGCCADVVGREFTLSRDGRECAWTFSEADFCGPSTGALNIVATLTGTTLTVTVQVTNGANHTTYTLTGTMPTDCRTWWRESIAFASATTSGTPPCNDPPGETAAGRVSYVSCECEFCQSVPEDLLIRIGGLYGEVDHEGEFTSCCGSLAGEWLLPYLGNCLWADSFDVCEDQLTLDISVEIVEEDEDTAKVLITATLSDAGTPLLEIVWGPTYPYPDGCSGGWNLDLGLPVSITEHDPDVMNCCDPCSAAIDTGTNVVDPNGDPTCPDPDPIYGCAPFADCCCPQPDCAGE